jgi:hypothetical protein
MASGATTKMLLSRVAKYLAKREDDAYESNDGRKRFYDFVLNISPAESWDVYEMNADTIYESGNGEFELDDLLKKAGF